MSPDRIRSTETKYCRIPQWLYETGISLQAIATYGWLHGRYGHFDRVMPSYNRLAKELGVSRGSVIAYVKELVTVGALRVVTSGAPGRQTNEYVIAFNEPFPAVTGQHSDQGVVSPLTRTGQPADPGGQRAVQEEDVVKKTKKDSLSTRATKRRATAAKAVEERETATPKNKPTPAAPAAAVEPELTDETSQVLAAYEQALGARALNGTRTKLLRDAAELLQARPLWWVIDRARELPRYGVDLAKHAAMSKVPVSKRKRPPRPSGLPEEPDYVPVQRDMSEILAVLRKPAP